MKNKQLLYALAMLLLGAPLLLLQYPPFADYPSHLARVYILGKYDTSPFFQSKYIHDTAPLCNLAIDIVGTQLAKAFGVPAAGKLFLLLLVAIYGSACFYLASSIGNRIGNAFLALCFLYNSAFLMGFTNYVAGVAVFLMAYAFWYRYEREWTVPRALGFSALVLLCYFCHVTSLAFLAISIGSAALARWIAGASPWRSGIVTGLAFVPAALFYMSYMRHSGSVGSIAWSPWKTKLPYLLTVVRTYNATFDAVLTLFLLGAVAYAFRRAKKVDIDFPTAAAAASLFLCYALAPGEMFTGSPVDGRFVWPTCVLFALAIHPVLSRRRTAVAAIAIGLVFLVRTSVLTCEWRGLDRKAGRLIELFQTLPRQAKVYPIFVPGNDVAEAKRNYALRHIPCYAVLLRDAYVPTVLAVRGQQPLVDRHPMKSYGWESVNAGVLDGFDYIWTYKLPRPGVRHLSEFADVVASADEGALWKLRAP